MIRALRYWAHWERLHAAPTPHMPASRRARPVLQSSFMRQFVGVWTVEPAAEGAGAGRCVIRHMLSVQPNVVPPAPIAHYTSGIFARQEEELLGDLQIELRRLQQQQQGAAR